MDFRGRLVATLRAIAPVLEEPGVLVIGSEIPNLLQPGSASTLVVSQDIDVGIPLESHAAVKRRLPELKAHHPSPEEPSVWLPDSSDLLELNFVGIDAALRDPAESYVRADPELPLMVFGALAWLRPGNPVEIEGLRVPVPRPAGLLLEKLVTDRSGAKGDRDLLVVLGLLLSAPAAAEAELADLYRALPPEARWAIRSNLTILSLMSPAEGMPDPRPHRGRIAALLVRLDQAEEALG